MKEWEGNLELTISVRVASGLLRSPHMTGKLKAPSSGIADISLIKHLRFGTSGYKEY